MFKLCLNYRYCCTNYKFEFKNFQKFTKILIIDKIAFLRKKKAKRKKKEFYILSFKTLLNFKIQVSEI